MTTFRNEPTSRPSRALTTTATPRAAVVGSTSEDCSPPPPAEPGFPHGRPDSQSDR